MIDLRRLDRIKTFGYSMYPLLHDGDIVYYRTVPFARLQLNDLIVVQQGVRAFTHRIVYTEKNFLVTKGDHNTTVDGYVLPEQIVGKVQYVKRKGEIFDPETLYKLQSSTYLREIQHINRLLQKAKVRYLFLKGLPLHLYYEDTYPRRLYADCDLLVDSGDLVRIFTLFEKAGYSCGIGIQNVITEVSFYKEVHGFPVVFDVHIHPVFLMTKLDVAGIFYPHALLQKFTAECLDTVQKMHVGKDVYPILEKHMLVVYLALHYFHHNHYGLYRLSLIPHIVRKEKIREKDWKKIQEITHRFQLGPYVAIAFFFMKKYMQIAIPDEFFVLLDIRHWKMLLIKKISKFPNILGEQKRIRAGIERFLLIFFLSEENIIKKSFYTLILIIRICLRKVFSQ